MTPKWIGTFLLCVGALNALIGIIMVIQLPPARVGFYPQVILVCGIVLMFCGYVTGKRRGGN